MREWYDQRKEAASARLNSYTCGWQRCPGGSVRLEFALALSWGNEAGCSGIERGQ